MYSCLLTSKSCGLLQFYVGRQNVGVPPLYVRNLPLSQFLPGGNKSQFSGGLYACLLGSLSNLHLKFLQLSLITEDNIVSQLLLHQAILIYSF